MADADLGSYQFQLAQVQQALKQDPQNEELQSLAASLQEMIDLMSVKPTATVKKKHYAVNDAVLAKYSADDNWYPATVTQVDESTVTVVYEGYGNTESLPLSDIKPPSSDKRKRDDVPVPPTASTTTTTSTTTSTPTPNAPHPTTSTTSTTSEVKKKKAKKERGPSEAEVVQSQKQAAWLSFSKGSKKMSKKTSIFATPDDPRAKVGVVGSGRDMTQYAHRGKHVFVRSESPSDT